MKGNLNRRRQELLQKTSGNGLECILITKPSNIFYFTGLYIEPYERFVGYIFNEPDQVGYLILPELEKGIPPEAGVKEVIYRDNENPFLDLARIAGECNTLGIEKSYLNLTTIENIQKAGIGVAALQDVGSAIDEMRMIKDEDEIEAIATASIYTDDTLKKAMAKIRPGVTEKEIKFELLRNIATIEGAMGEAFSIQVSSGPNSARPHGIISDRKLSNGDTVIIDFGVIYKHYKSDMTRTLFIGKPNPDMEEVYQVVREAQQEAIDIIKPGIPIHDIDLTARRVIEDSGYGEYFTHRIGHGLGIDIHEAPSINNQNKSEVKEGMVFSVEPGIYLPDLGGVRIEDSVAVVSNGCRVLNHFPKAINEIAIN